MRLRKRGKDEGERQPQATEAPATEPPEPELEEAIGAAPPEPHVALRHRRRQEPARDRRIMLRLSQDEYDDIARAAVDHARTPSGYAAEAALRAARNQTEPEAVGVLREALVELMTARTQVRQVGVNLNQAVMVLNATGDAPAHLGTAIEKADRAIADLDKRSAELARRIRHGS